jgi:hypothetical protein
MDYTFIDLLDMATEDNPITFSKPDCGPKPKPEGVTKTDLINAAKAQIQG